MFPPFFLLYNLMVYWHDIEHKLHAIVAFHVTKVIKMITGVMQPTYNPILVRNLNKFWFCANRLSYVGNSPLIRIHSWQSLADPLQCLLITGFWKNNKSSKISGFWKIRFFTQPICLKFEIRFGLYLERSFLQYYGEMRRLGYPQAPTFR